jgi:hypothetical protein
MSNVIDVWFIRFPDGRVLRAASTTVVRQQLGAGRIPAASTVRRGPDEEWVSLGWTEEFADLVAARPVANGGTPAPAAPSARRPRPPAGEHAGLSSRLDPTHLQTVGVRGLVEELIAALDGTLVRRKLTFALLGALILGLLAALMPLRLADFGKPGTELLWALAAAVVLAVGALVTALLTRMTFVELSRLRPARWREVASGLPALAVRVAVAQFLVMGGTLAVIGLLRRLPAEVLPPGTDEVSAARQWGATVAVAAGVLAEVALWPVFSFALLLAPLLAVEGVSVATGLVQWFRLVRGNLGRVFLYEALAAGVGLVATLPLFLPLLAFAGRFEDPRFDSAVTVARAVFIALALAPLFAYLVVANVFIYLNLRYETPRR